MHEKLYFRRKLFVLYIAYEQETLSKGILEKFGPDL